MTTNKNALDAIRLIKSYRHYMDDEKIQKLFLDHISTIETTLTQPNQALVEATYHDTDYNSPLRPKRLEYTMCGKIYAVQENGERHMFMDVRGWGYLTGGGAKKLPYEEATVIQDKWANEVCNLWNAASETPAPVIEVVEGLEKAWHEKGATLEALLTDDCKPILEAARIQLARQNGVKK